MRFAVDPKSFSKDKEREKAGKSNVMIRFEYWLMPERAIIVYADDIHDTDAIPGANPQYGEGCLLYPTYGTRGITPRMRDAKKKVIAGIEAGNFEVVQVSAQAAMHVINFVFLANSLLLRTSPPQPEGASVGPSDQRSVPEATRSLAKRFRGGCQPARLCIRTFEQQHACARHSSAAWSRRSRYRDDLCQALPWSAH